MSAILENLAIERLVIHEIYKRESTGSVPPLLNEEMTRLEPRGFAELQKRITEAVGNDSHSIEMEFFQTDEGTVYSHIVPFLYSKKNDDDFIAMSHRLTNKLVQCQTTKIIPGGIVLVLQGTTGESCLKYICIIKADKISGFSISTADKATIMHYLNNLLLTEQQKLYKVALLVRKSADETGPPSPDDVLVNIFDSNNQKASSDASANYFYELFLGCTFQRKNDVLTRDFYNHTKDFITKKSNLNGEQKVEAMSALYVYLKVRTMPTISVNEFAREYLPTAIMMDSYKAYMTSQKVPTTDIRRDLSMITKKLKRRRIRFTNFVEISAPVDDFKENIQIVSSDENGTMVSIKAAIATEA